MRSHTNTRDPGIEFARIIGCLIVIGTHISLGYYENGSYDLTRGYINCLLADGVAVFWMITGCFLFAKSSYKEVLLRAAKTIVLPVALYCLFCLHFYDWISSGSFQFRLLDLSEYWAHLNNALAMELTIPGTIHIWYCYAYILIMLAFPLLRAFALWLAEDVKREKWFCAISCILLALNDYTQNRMLAFSHHGLNAAVPAAIQILFGFILYRHKDWFCTQKRYVCLLSIPVFFLMNLIRLNILNTASNREILFWYSTIGLICAICAVMFSVSISAGIRRVSWLHKIVNQIARHTFFIYLVHIPVRDVLLRSKMMTRFIHLLSQLGQGMIFEIAYTVTVAASVFLVSLLISIVWCFLSNQCLHLKKQLFNH